MQGDSGTLQRQVRAAARMGLRGVGALKQSIKSNKLIADLIYDSDNAGSFTGFYGHEKMLADRIRVDTYAAGIARHIQPGDVVMDLGTGTGILAMLAAKRGATVYAIDHSNLIGVAERLAAANGIDGIHFVQSHSQEFTCPEKIDVLLHEQLGDCLFDENMVDNLLDTKRRFLKDGGRILPGRFEFFVEPVAVRDGMAVPHLWDMSLHGIDYGLLRDLPEADPFKARGDHIPYFDPAGFDHYLAVPEPVLTFDLNTLTDPGDVPTQLTASRTVTQPGTIAGFCIYFRLLFDDEINLSTAPDQTKTHWGNRIFRVPAADYAAGDVIDYRIDIGRMTDPESWTLTLT